MLDKLLLLTLTAFTLGSLGQISRGSGFNFYLFDLVVVGANLYLLLFFLKKKKFYINSPLILFSFFSVFSLVITLFNLSGFTFLEQIFTVSFWLRFNLYFMFAYFVLNCVKFNFISLQSLKNTLLYNFYFLLFLNFIQYILIRDISFMEVYGFDPHTQRLTGFFLDPNFMGFYLLLYFYCNETYLKNKYVSYLALVMIFLTDSRSAVLCLSIYLIYLLFQNFKQTFIYIILSTLLFLFSNLTARFELVSASNDSSALRYDSWQNALTIYNFGPDFGIGFSNYRNYLKALNLVSPENYYLNSSNYSDSSLLSVLVFSGIGGIIIFLAFLLSYVASKNNLILLILILINSFIINSLFFPALTLLIFLLLNLGLLEN